MTKYVEREIKNHRILVHPHIIHFKEVFLTDKYLGIVMEYAAGGDMFEYVAQKEGLHENEARWFFQQLVMAIDYCHIMVRPCSHGTSAHGPILGELGTAATSWCAPVLMELLSCMALVSGDSGLRD